MSTQGPQPNTSDIFRGKHNGSINGLDRENAFVPLVQALQSIRENHFGNDLPVQLKHLQVDIANEIALASSHPNGVKLFLIRESSTPGFLTISYISHNGSKQNIRLGCVYNKQGDKGDPASYSWQIIQGDNPQQVAQHVKEQGYEIKLFDMSLAQSEQNKRYMDAFFSYLQSRGLTADKMLCPSRAQASLNRAYITLSSMAYITVNAPEESSLQSLASTQAKRMQTINDAIAEHCPISYKLLVDCDAVAILPSGHKYDLQSLALWLNVCAQEGQPATDPMTRQVIDRNHDVLITTIYTKIKAEYTEYLKHQALQAAQAVPPKKNKQAQNETGKFLSSSAPSFMFSKQGYKKFPKPNDKNLSVEGLKLSPILQKKR